MCSDVFLFFEQKTISFLKILSGSYLCMKLLYFDFLVMFPPGFNLEQRMVVCFGKLEKTEQSYTSISSLFRKFKIFKCDIP